MNPAIRNIILRILIYGVLLLLVSQLIYVDALEDTNQKFKEESWTEYLQVITLFLTALIFYISAHKWLKFRGLGILLGGAATIAFIREFDVYLDTYVFDGVWQTLAVVAAISIMWMTYKWRKGLMEVIQYFIGTRSFGLCLGGFLTVFVFSRMFGRQIFWRAVMEEGYIRSVKNAAEEGLELLGYLLIFMSAIEFFITIREFHERSGPV